LFVCVVLFPTLCWSLACNAEGLNGLCVTDCPDGIFIPDYCSTGECCVNYTSLPACKTPQGNGVCMASGACNGKSNTGNYCPGPELIQCCVAGTNYSFDYGVDVSVLTSQQSFECLKQQGYSFVVVRCWQELNHPDPNCPQTIANALAAGFQTDIYLYPAYPINATQQVLALHSFILQNNIQFGRLFLDIEGTWGTDCELNTQYLQQLVDASLSLGIPTGIYSSLNVWEHSINFCGTYDFSALPLWYPRYDYYGNEDNFNDWQPFGSWQWPVAKQFDGTSEECGASIDKNIRLTTYKS